MQKKGVAAAGGSTRHYYCACAAGVAAVLTQPTPIDQSWAGAALPIIGGRSASQAGPVIWPSPLDPVLRFDSARTEITGRQTAPGEYTTIIRISVANLNILNRITGSIDVGFTFVYKDDPNNNRNKDVVDVTITPAEPFARLAVPGVSSVGISFNPSLFTGAGKDFKKLRNDMNTIRPGKKHRKHPHGEAGGHGHGILHTALAEPAGTFTYDDPDFGMIAVPDLGKVYFGEWSAEPYRQNFTVLRVELLGAQDKLNPQSKFTGQIVIDEDENGRTG